VDALEPDVVITDIRMPPGHHMEGIAAAHTIREVHPSIGVVVLSQHAEEGYAFELLRDGTAGLGYLLKERVGDLDELFRAIREVMAGRSVIDPKVVEGLVARQARVSTSAVHKLTPRERDVLGEMAQGKTNAAIGESLHLSLSAVEKHVNAIFMTLGLTEEAQVNKRVAAVLLFLRDSGLTPA
jgi:DNA-binding NarL/FixJ family response regulator